MKQKILPKGHRNRPGYPMNPIGVLFHTTNNWKDGSGDEMHGEYMESTQRVISWHATVDKDSATQHIPFNENAWHAGDGNGHYNRHWIGVEIACEAVEPGEPLDSATYNNAVKVIADTMKEQGLTKLEPHAIVYGKDCPHHTLMDREQFKKDVFKAMEKQIFPDVSNDRWSKSEISIAVQNGLMNGYPDGTFRPADTVSREELAVTLVRLMNMKGVK
jgi:N-acetylmuramoyl-L-alanine amidase